MSLKQEFELLRRVPFFSEIEPAKLKLLAFMSERVAFDDGKCLFRQGDPGDVAYLIIDGEAEVIVETPAGPVVRGDTRRQRDHWRDGDSRQCAAHGNGARQRPADHPAHFQGAVHAHGPGISEHGGSDHAGAGRTGWPRTTSS